MKDNENVTNSEANTRVWNGIKLIVLVVILLNSLFTTIILLRNGYLVFANNIILERFEARIQHYESGNHVSSGPQFEKLRMDLSCPPCPTTPPPSVVIPNKDPVSVLHVAVGQVMTYECNYLCKKPPIHTTKLVIDKIDGYPGSWEGKGSSKKKSKQQAAYLAIEQYFPELLSDLDYEDDLYNPTCQDALRHFEPRAKC